ncbi:MAG TPA: condensation domain-containing protein, partial [Streptosporangiaceae bacterium]
ADFPLARLDQATVDRLAGDGRNIDDIWPLTPLQAGMLFHTLVEPGMYLGQASLIVDGASDPEALSQAWQQVVDRTPALRAGVVWEGVAEPLQVIHSQVTLPVTRHDWRSLPEHERDQRLAQLLAGDRAAGLDLTRPPLLRLAIARLPGDQVMLAWTGHHLLLDGWSLSQVLADVFHQYAANVSGRAPRQPARRPFRDYLHWLRGQDPRQAEEHWRQVLSGFGSPTPLPFDRHPAEAHRTESSQTIHVALTGTESARLNDTARRGGLTLSTVVQGAWAVLLSRYSGERDVVFGTTVSGRPDQLPGAEDMVGMFINTIPTRTRVREGQDTLTWLRELQVQQSQSRRFDYVALSQLQAWSDLPPGENLFGSIVVFENYPFDEESAAQAGLRVRPAQALDTTNFPLSLSAYLAGDLQLQLDFDPRLFDATTAAQLAGRLRMLLTALADQPDRPVGELPWMAPEERQRILTGSTGPRVQVPPATFPELFEAQAARTPDQTAVVCGPTMLTFAELNARANRLARHLVSRGVGPERVVGVALPRSAAMVVAMLAVAKAGGVYMPVDPGLPAARIGMLVADSRPVLVVTGPGAGLAGGVPVLELSEDGTAAVLAGERDSDLADADRDGPLRPGNAAYMIYTSGSTGTPKGVVVDHQSLVSLAASHRDGLVAAAGGERLRVALTASFSFDTSLDELVLMAGGHELHVIGEAVRLDPRALVGYVAAHRVDFMDLTPTYLQQLLPAGLLSGPHHHPRILMLGGEALGESLWRELAAVPATASYNFYGPTECTVDALSCRVAGDRP